MKVVCNTLDIARSSFYAWRRDGSVAGNRRKRSGSATVPEEMLLAAIDEVRRAVLEFLDRFSRQWLVEHLGYRSPKKTYAAFLATRHRSA